MLDIYSDAFLRVGLQMNGAKTKSMIMIGKKVRDRNYRSIDHGGLTAKEYQAMKVCCNRCNTLVRRDYMERHKDTKRCMTIWKRVQQQNGNAATQQPNDSTFVALDNGNDSNNYCFSVDGVNETFCPVEGCTFKSSARYKFRVHFRDRHVKDAIHIIEEGMEPLPRCPRCGIFQKDVGNKHQETISCKKYALRMELQQTTERNQTLGRDTVFTVFGERIEQVHEFKYLGRMVTDTDDDRTAVITNLQKAVQTWGHLFRLLSRESKRNTKVVASIYRSIIQSRLLYGSETWVIPSRLLRMLETFHRRCIRFLTRDFIRKTTTGDWYYPNMTEMIKSVGLESIETYIIQRRKHVEKHLTDSKAIQEIESSLDIDINMERVQWWKSIPEPVP